MNFSRFRSLCCWGMALFLFAASGVAVFSEESGGEPGSISVVLSEGEKAWIRDHPVIRLGIDSEFAPFEYIDEKGRYCGITSDYIKLLNERLGLNMQRVPNLTWKEAVEGARLGEVDVLPSVGLTEERRQFLVYSAPYIEFQRVIITRANELFITGLDDIRGMKVVVQADSSHEGFLKDTTAIKAISHKTLRESLLAVSGGRADAFVGNIASATYWITKLNLTNLKVAAPVSSKVDSLHFAVRGDWPELVGILDKGLASIQPGKRDAIQRHWITVDQVSGIAPNTVFVLLAAILGGALLIFSGFMVWNRMLRREVRRKTKVLREREENLTITLNSIGDAVISVDIEKRVVRMNPVAEALTGWTVAEALGHPLDEVFNIIHARTREKAENPVERVLREGVVVGLANHTALIARDGTEYQISDSAAPIRNVEGKVVGVVLVFRDVTELYEKEEALRQSELKYRSFFENSTDAMLIIENDQFVDCNAAAISLLKSDGREEILNTHPSRLSPEIQPDGRSSVGKANEIMQLAKERGSHRFDWMHQRKDGTVFPVEVSLTSIATERGTPQLHTVWRDMTEKREVEQALRESEARYRMLVEGQTDLIVKMDVDGRFLFVSPSYCALFGKSEEELLGHAFFPLVHEDDQAATEEAMKDLFTPPHKVLMEQRAMTKDGCRWLAWQNSAILDENGEVAKIIGIGRDVTERKQVEEERARLSTAIDQVAEVVVITDVEGMIQYVNPAFERITGYSCAEAIGQNPRILQSGEQDDSFYQAMWKTIVDGERWSGHFVNRKRDGTRYTEEATISPVKDSTGRIVNYVAIKVDITVDLIREDQVRQMQKMESVGRLAGGIAHDFNNILQTITGFCGLILAGVESQTVQREDVAEIQRAARFAGKLTQQLLAFSRKQPSKYKRTDLNTVLSDGEKMLRQALDDTIQLRVTPEPRLMPVHADASQILQIAMNLVVNARDAMPDGGGTITVQMQNVEIQERDLPDWPNSKVGKWGCFSVSDTGCGMNEKQMEHLFDPFYTTKQIGKGTGLGLSVVYGIVEEHGGWISVSSEPGMGAVFQVFLPVHDAAKSGGSIDVDMFLGKRILLVEDDSVIRELTAEILQDVGYAVSVAADVAEAEQLFDGHHGEFDLLFCDVVLPDGNGIELAGFCQEQQPGLPVLFFTGSSDPSMVAQIEEKGFDFIRKPFSLKKLLDRVDWAIARRNG